MIHSIFVLNTIGDIIIEKHYRGLLSRSICDFFWEEVRKASKPEETLPIIQTPKYNLIHIQRNGLFILCVVAGEVAPLLVIEFLHRVCDVFGQYSDPKFSEQTIRDNFVTVYQLLDEMMDSGFPFLTEPNALMEMIPPPKGIKKWVGDMTGQSQMSGVLSEGSLTNTPWRKTGVRYATNEIYFDIVEELDATIDPNGLPVSSEVSGEVQVVCKLSGMPDMSLIFSNPHILDDVSFHPCVRYNRFEQNKVVSFVPPDGSFKLMNYRVKGQLQIPIYVKPQISWNQSGGKVNVMVGPKNLPNGKVVEDVVVTIPFPKVIGSTTLTANHGQVQYDEVSKVCRWIIGKLPPTKTPMLEGTVSLPPGIKVDSNPVLQAEFRMQMYAVSGLKVETLTLHNEKYKPFKGVRSFTKGGKFHIRS